MVLPAIKDQILDDLERLSPELQHRALELVRGLATVAPKGASIEDLMGLASTFGQESAREMREAIELRRGESLADLDVYSSTAEDREQAVKKLLEISRRVTSGSGGRRWTREELHER